jgi:hypothetical protein
MRATLAALAALAALLVLAGCDSSNGSDKSADPAPTTTAADTDPCQKVSDADLTAWVGSKTTIQDGGPDGSLTRCKTTITDERWMIEWELGPSTGTLEDMASDDLGATASRALREVTLPGGTRAYEYRASVGKLQSQVRVYTVVDGTFIAVGSASLANSGRVTPLAKLSSVARRIANEYAG